MAADAHGSLFLMSAAFCAAVSTFVFIELYHLRKQTDLVVLAGLFLVAAYCLTVAYKALLQLRRGASRDASAAYFVIFQGNFFFFSAFALLSCVVVPAFGTSRPTLAGLPWSWLHSALSILPASALVYALPSF